MPDEAMVWPKPSKARSCRACLVNGKKKQGVERLQSFRRALRLTSDYAEIRVGRNASLVSRLEGEQGAKHGSSSFGFAQPVKVQGELVLDAQNLHHLQRTLQKFLQKPCQGGSGEMHLLSAVSSKQPGFG